MTYTTTYTYAYGTLQRLNQSIPALKFAMEGAAEMSKAYPLTALPINDNYRAHYATRDGDVIVGMLLWHPYYDGTQAFVHFLYVNDFHREDGIAKELVKRFRAEIQNMPAVTTVKWTTHLENNRALRIYEKLLVDEPEAGYIDCRDYHLPIDRSTSTEAA